MENSKLLKKVWREKKWLVYGDD